MFASAALLTLLLQSSLCEPPQNDLIIEIANSNTPNSTLFESHSLIMDYGGYGVSVSKTPTRSALDVEVFETNEGRSKKSTFLNVLIGYKLAAVATLGFAAMGGLAFKAFIAAKIAAIASTVQLFSNLFSSHKSHAAIELDHPPHFHYGYESGPPEVEYHPSGSELYYSYSNYPENISNSSGPGIPAHQQVAKRRVDKRKVPLYRIQQYSTS